jgi:hypothetical protein
MICCQWCLPVVIDQTPHLATKPLQFGSNSRNLASSDQMEATMIGYEGQRWVALFHFVGWDCISLGFHVCVTAPNVELHLPFGFIRVGRRRYGGWPFK